MPIREHTISQSPLPSGYRQLEYIESTGTQYIDSGLSSNNGFDFDLIFAFTQAQGNAYVVGSHNLSSPYGRNGVQSSQVGATTRMFGMGCGDTIAYSSTGFYGYLLSSTLQYNVDEIYRIQGSTIKGTPFLNVNNIAIFNFNDSGVRSSNSLLIFYEQYSKNRSQPTTKGRLYSLTLTVNSIIHTMFPALRIADSKPGLYDTENNQFYTNAGTGEFLYD